MIIALLLALAPAIHWQPLSDEAFTRAKAEHKLVLLDVEAVWCHWCHVMDDETYAAPSVRALVAEKFLAVRVDQDADPAVSQRYETWGWPATVVFDAEGNELARRRGFLPAPELVALLKAPRDSNEPVRNSDSPAPDAKTNPSSLTEAQREDLKARLFDSYDQVNGGFGQPHHDIAAAPIEAALVLSHAGDSRFEEMAPKTLAGGLHLIDSEWGGIYQYSATIDWLSPHHEKIIASQAEGLRAFSLGYALFKDARFLAAAQGIAEYIDAVLTDSSGAFKNSQDADLSREVDGAKFYALKSAARNQLGKIPRVDGHLYAQGNGLAIAALAEFSEKTGDVEALARAVRAARWIIAERSVAGGGFRHGAEPVSESRRLALADTLAMGEAFLALYTATAEREWLARAEAAARFIEANFAGAAAGSAAGFSTTQMVDSPDVKFTKSPTGASAGVFGKPIFDVEQNAALARFANLLWRYSGQPADRALAEKAMKFAASNIPEIRPVPEVLLADLELSTEPVHMTVVGAKSDPAARALFAAALAVPRTYARIEWWDPAGGPLPNADVPLPNQGRAAAYVCTGNACSLPLHDPAKIAANALR